MKVAVKDANVFIDLESMGLLDLWFQLGIETLTSSFVVMELEDGGHHNALACIKAGLAVEAVISSEEMAGAFSEFLDGFPDSGMSDADLSVLYLAVREDAILLSGDRLLRNTGKAKGLKVHGTLWILDRLVTGGLLKPRVAADRLEALMLRQAGSGDTCLQMIVRNGFTGGGRGEYENELHAFGDPANLRDRVKSDIPSEAGQTPASPPKNID